MNDKEKLESLVNSLRILMIPYEHPENFDMDVYSVSMPLCLKYLIDFYGKDLNV